jgi:hypothetical protein
MVFGSKLKSILARKL